MRSTLVSPLSPHEMAAKMLANGSLPTNTNGMAQYNPLLLAMLQPLALQQLLHAQALQQQYMVSITSVFVLGPFGNDVECVFFRSNYNNKP